MSDDLEFSKAVVGDPDLFIELEVFRVKRKSDGVIFDIRGINQHDYISFYYRVNDRIVDFFVAAVEKEEKTGRYILRPVLIRLVGKNQTPLPSEFFKSDIMDILPRFPSFKRVATSNDDAQFTFDFSRVPPILTSRTSR